MMPPLTHKRACVHCHCNEKTRTPVVKCAPKVHKIQGRAQGEDDESATTAFPISGMVKYLEYISLVFWKEILATNSNS